MGKGYMGTILMVDLGAGDIWEETIPDAVYENFLSGVGLGAFLLYQRIPPNADPLGPENILGFVSGLLTGTGALFTGRWMAVAKSPLTGGWGDANCGGTFSPAIKKCGYDGVFFTGVSKKPVYVFADGETVEIRDAGHLWGRDAVETEEILLKEIDNPNTRVACIGRAGENRSLISGISNDKGRIAARAGLGAVMGSKNLKAVALAGAGHILPFNRGAIKKERLKTLVWVNAQPPLAYGKINAILGGFMRKLPVEMAMDGLLYKVMLKKWGTVSMNQMSVEIGDAPIKNWKGSNEDFDRRKTANFTPDIFTNREITKYYCYSCPLGCGGICKVKGGEPHAETHKPEYETVLALGGLLMNEDTDSVFILNEMLNRAGMDSISAGHTVAFAMECYEKGILTKEDTGGIDLSWGNTEGILEVVRRMIAREGIGDVLADGVKAASRRIGQGSEAYAMHAGGQELAMHDGRNDPGFALHYSVEPTPGRHTMGSFIYYDMFQLWRKIKSLPKPGMIRTKDSKYKASLDQAVRAAACSKFMNVANGAGLCLFGALMGVHRLPIFEWLNAAAGWEKTPEEYMEMGEKIQTMKQAFNIRQGIEPAAMKASERALGRPPLERGANRGRSINVEKMMQDYWELFSWAPQTGKPTEEAMNRLGMDR